MTTYVAAYKTSDLDERMLLKRNPSLNLRNKTEYHRGREGKIKQEETREGDKLRVGGWEGCLGDGQWEEYVLW